ncbi:translocase of outer mitochondrial membrane [Allomyces javanicus]|nr:translocase of outer mitochondrial membrane [Allomyces javanicus]
MSGLFGSLTAKFDDLRAALNLPSPGKFEELHRKAQFVFTTHHMFDGLKVDIGKGMSPTFQVNHAFHLGSQAQPNSYTFGAVVAEDAQNMMHGMIETDGSLTGRMSYGLTKALTAKANIQFSTEQDQAMLQAEADYAGRDYAANLKVVNPSPVDATGIVVASYLQSVTPKLALGVEAVLQRPIPGIEDAGMSFAARYTLPRFHLDALPAMSPQDIVPEQPTADPVLTATYQSAGALHLTYVHPVSSKVELASEAQMVVTPRGREGVGAVAAKYEFRQSTFRTQIDTNGRVSSVLEQRMGPMAFLLAGEIDHVKGAARFGFGLHMEI